MYLCVWTPVSFKCQPGGQIPRVTVASPHEVAMSFAQRALRFLQSARARAPTIFTPVRAAFGAGVFAGMPILTGDNFFEHKAHAVALHACSLGFMGALGCSSCFQCSCRACWSKSC